MRLCLLWLALSLYAEDLPITGISHVALRVTDLEKGRAYYTGVLGFPEAFQMKKPDGSVNIACMKVNDDQYIEVQPGLPAGEKVRLTHVSLVTTDIEKLHRMLTARGLSPTPLRPPGGDGNRAIRIADPDGNPIEFTQYLPGSLHSNARGKFEDPRRISVHLLHAGIPTKQPAAALAFYKEKLGFVEIWPLAPGNESLQQWNLRMPGPRADYIELMANPDAQHVCLEVDAIQTAHKTMLERGMKDEPRSQPKVGKTRRWLFSTLDPDGTRIEMIEPRVARMP